MKKTRALLILKPDAVQRGLMGRIIQRFERAGLTIVGLKFTWAKKEQIVAHYPETKSWFEKVGRRTLDNYAKKGLDARKIFKTNNPLVIGKTVKDWLIKYLQESPLLLVVVEGYDVIEIVRKLSGNTIPLLAAPGTIRGDFSHDTIDLANEQNRPLRNLIHASDSEEDGEKEIATWFRKQELFSYQRADEKFMFPSSKLGA